MLTPLVKVTQCKCRHDPKPCILYWSRSRVEKTPKPKPKQVPVAHITKLLTVLVWEQMRQLWNYKGENALSLPNCLGRILELCAVPQLLVGTVSLKND